MIPVHKFECVDFGDLGQYVNETPKGHKEVLPDFAIGISIFKIKFSLTSSILLFILCIYLLLQ